MRSPLLVAVSLLSIAATPALAQIAQPRPTSPPMTTPTPSPTDTPTPSPMTTPSPTDTPTPAPTATPTPSTTSPATGVDAAATTGAPQSATAGTVPIEPTVGATVYGAAGTPVGTIKAMDAQFVTLATDKGEVRLPAAGVGPGLKGSVIGLTAAQLDAAMAQAKAGTKAPAR